MNAWSFAIVDSCSTSRLAKKPLTTFALWCHVHLIDCSFRGKFSGNDFGSLPGVYEPVGSIVGGDFREAILDGCRVLGAETGNHRFAPWPTIVIDRPRERLAELLAATWPARVRILIESFAMSPAPTALLALQAAWVLKKFGGTENELREAFARFELTRS